MTAISKICVLGLMTQAAVGLPRAVITDLNNNTVAALPAANDTEPLDQASNNTSSTAANANTGKGLLNLLHSAFNQENTKEASDNVNGTQGDAAAANDTEQPSTLDAIAALVKQAAVASNETVVERDDKAEEDESSSTLLGMLINKAADKLKETSESESESESASKIAENPKKATPETSNEEDESNTPYFEYITGFAKNAVSGFADGVKEILERRNLVASERPSNEDTKTSKANASEPTESTATDSDSPVVEVRKRGVVGWVLQGLFEHFTDQDAQKSPPDSESDSATPGFRPSMLGYDRDVKVSQVEEPSATSSAPPKKTLGKVAQLGVGTQPTATVNSAETTDVPVFEGFFDKALGFSKPNDDDASSKSKRVISDEDRFVADAADFAVEEFTTGYTKSQSTAYARETTVAFADTSKVAEAFTFPTEPSLVEAWPSEGDHFNEKLEYGAYSPKEEEKENKKEKVKGELKEQPKQEPKEEPKGKPEEQAKEQAKQEPQEEPKQEPKQEPKEESKEEPKGKPEEELKEEPQEDPEEKTNENETTANDENQDDKKKYGAVEKRGQYDQQWADYFNKAGIYEGSDYDPHEYLKAYQAEHPAQVPQPAPEEKPVFIPPPEQPVVPQPQPAPQPPAQPQNNGPAIPPAPQHPPPEQAPAPVQPGQPGEEKYEDFVMFVPKDQSGGAKPYMVPADEYNPQTPPQRLPPGVQPPPPPIKTGPPPPESPNSEVVPEANANVPVAPEHVPGAPAGAPLSTGPHVLPDWFPTRPGTVAKRDELEERSCPGHPFGRQFACSNSDGCNGCADEPPHHDYHESGSSLSAVAKRGLRNKISEKISKPFKSTPSLPETPKIPKPAVPNFDYNNKANEFTVHTGPPPPPPPPSSNRNLAVESLPKSKSKPFKLDIDLDDDDDDDDEHNVPVLLPPERSIKLHPHHALADFRGSGKSHDYPSYGASLAEYISCELFRSQCLGFEHFEPDYPGCRQLQKSCPQYPLSDFPRPEPEVEPENTPCEPEYGPCPAYDYHQPEQRPGVPAGEYTQIELQPDMYPEYKPAKPEYYAPECHACGLGDGSYPERFGQANTYIEDTRPDAEYAPQREAQEPCPDCVHPYSDYHEKPEQDCNACEQPECRPQPSQPVPQPAEACYDCQPETHPLQPQEPVSKPQVPEQPEYHGPEYHEPVQEAQPETVSEYQPMSPEQPCHTCEQTPQAHPYEPQPVESTPQPYEPAPQPQPQEPCYSCEQPEAPEQPAEPQPQPQQEEPCHGSDYAPSPAPQPEAPCNGPNFKQPEPDYPPQDGSYPVEEPAAPQPPPVSDDPQPEAPYIHRDGSYSHKPVEQPENYPAYPPPEPTRKPSYPWHFPASAFEQQEAPVDEEQQSEPECHECQQSPAPEATTPEQPQPPQYQPTPDPECHECQQGPEQYAPEAYQAGPETEYHEYQEAPEYNAQPYEAQPSPEQRACPCERNGEPEGAYGGSCAC